MYFDSRQLGIQRKKVYKTLDYWSRDMPNFDLDLKGLGLVSRRMSLMLYSINRPNFIA